MKKTILSIIVVFAFLFVCTGVWAGGRKDKGMHPEGIYIGVIPAADCPGIAVVAILNTQGEYKITYQYIDRGVEVFTFTGIYKLDEASRMITLDGKNLPPYYKVGKHGLTQLDMEGNDIKGKLRDLYKLRKVEFS